MTSTSSPAASRSADTHRRSTLFSVLIGLASLVVLLQAVWAGIFLEHDGGRGAAHVWVSIHADGAYVAVVLAAAATVTAFVVMRARRDLWIGALVLTLLLVVETGLGKAIRDAHQDVLTAVHVPLAMLIMALAVWIPLRSARR